MYLFKTIASLRRHLEEKQSMGKAIGFVPTMGALHSGHGALISHSVMEGCYTVVSIFVNPTQFNEPEDLEKYPRPLSRDLKYLHKLGCDVLFMPSDQEIYPENDEPILDFELGHLNETLEAAFRPGHFEGVLQVMHRLLEIVKPDYVFMGKKDLQQLTIVRELIRQTGLSVQLIGLPIVREPNGLARSSRNERLSPENREQASVIYETLKSTAKHFTEYPLAELRKVALEKLNREPFRPEYFEFVDSDNLKILNSKDHYDGPVTIVTAVWCGDVRLIDNVGVSSW